MISVSVERFQALREVDWTGDPWMQIIAAGTKVWIPGWWLEACFACHGSGYVLFSTDDIPYEEKLNVVLLDQNARLIDTKSIFSMYATGHLHNVTVLASHAVSFSFFGGDLWVATVVPGVLKPRPKLVPRCLWRGLRVKRLA